MMGAFAVCFMCRKTVPAVMGQPGIHVCVTFKTWTTNTTSVTQTFEWGRS